MDNSIQLPEIFKIPSASRIALDTELNHLYTPSEKQFFPLWFEKHPMYDKGSKDPTRYFFPFEPIMSVSVKKIIAKRRPAKATKLIGTIKEVFATEDFQIQIIGTVQGPEILGNPKPEDCFPIRDMMILNDYFKSCPRIKVYNDFLLIFGITEITIESIEYPFTKGENVLGYVINAVSNFEHELLYQKSRGEIIKNDDLTAESISDLELQESVLEGIDDRENEGNKGISIKDNTKKM